MPSLLDHVLKLFTTGPRRRPERPAAKVAFGGASPAEKGDIALDKHRAAAPAHTEPEGLGALSAYAAEVRGFDEMIGPDGGLRPHWRPVHEFLQARSGATCRSISDRIQRRIVENGLTLDSFSDPESSEQPWSLNLVPFIISSSEWSQIEQGLIQRMRVMEALLGDLYGPQEVLAKGLLPPSLVFNDPTFLLPAHGVAHDEAPRLMLMAVDLARDNDGGWQVIDTHAETVAGHGYALANRVVLADVCAGLFRDCNALRISNFYQEVAEECIRRAGGKDPSIAILGPNPDHETYLGHAYLARYLGYTLLEGNDLRVVGDRVYQKTLAGLQPIDLIIRAIEAAKSDPLELDPNGFDGPAGFVQAMRARPASVANALGTAIVENRGIAPYLNSLSEHFIGEALKLPDANRLWLGDAAIQDQVLPDIESYLIRPAFEGPARPGHAVPGQKLADIPAEQRAGFQADVVLNGSRFVAETPVSFATAPVWTADGLKPKPCALRLFVAATADGYSVMPGGLALTIESGAAVALSSEQAESRDVWIRSTEPQGPHFSRWRISDDAAVERLGGRLPSRIADNMFWLGRYVERADWTMRMMRNALSRGDEDVRSERRADAAATAINLIERKDTAATGEGEAIATSLEDRVALLLSNATNPFAVRQALLNIRRLARQSRDRLSLDAWRILSRLTDVRDGLGAPPGEAGLDLVERLDRRIADLAAFNGLSHENMTRNFVWRFSDLGRRVERAVQASELIGQLLVTPPDEGDEAEILAFLLETADCFLTYRARYRFAPTFPLVLDLLMLDETNPRSVAYQLVRIADHLNEMPKASQDAVRTPEQRNALELLTMVRLSDLEALRVSDDTGSRAKLNETIEAVVKGLPELSDIISRRYFSLTAEQPHRVHTRLVP